MRPKFITYVLLAIAFRSVAAPTEGGKIAAAAAAEAAQQRRIYAAQEAENQRRAALVGAQKEELQLIYSKDPWRVINGVTNSIAGPGW
ncbi:MAG TPA: hypothetical protein VF607_15970, partial [Verrucomicrobiae bacterium]